MIATSHPARSEELVKIVLRAGAQRLLAVARLFEVMPRRALPWVVAATVGLVPTLVMAHHSFALFDQTKTVAVKGVVGRYEWTNPHVAVYIDVPGPTPQRLKVETGSVNALSRQGWKATDIKVGDKAEVTFHPLKSGDPGGLLIEIKTDSIVLKGGG